MAKEHPALRDCFEDLLDFFEGKRVLTQSDICRYTGRTPKWVKAHYGVGDHKAIGTKAFARMLCEPSCPYGGASTQIKPSHRLGRLVPKR